jgi:2-octaprenyl-6-methoxyphenol hydroxylase
MSAARAASHSSSHSSSTSTPLVKDVLIVGGGLVGGTLACALARHGIEVAVIDGTDPKALLAAEYDGRCSAIALACQKVLDAVGLWDLMADETQPIRDIRVADGQSPLFLHYWEEDAGGPMGYMAENRSLRKAILKMLPTLPSATLLAPARLATLDRAADGVTAVLEDGQEIRARLVLACDGRRSQVREMAGIGVKTLGYGQTAIVLTVEHEKPHDGCAVEHFLPAGPFAILPMPKNTSSLVWTEKDHLVAGILALPDDLFQAELELRFGDFLGKVKPVGPRFSYPLTLQFADRYVDTRLALVGDAAHGMHPVAGQGMNYGLRDVAVITEILVNAARLGTDLGTSTLLADYQALRRYDNLLMLGITDVLVRLFSNDVKPLALARRLGLAAVDKMTPLKKLFMSHAMGTVNLGPTPKLMKGESL